MIHCSGFDPDAVRKEEAGVKNSNDDEIEVDEEDSVEILDDCTENLVKEEEVKEEDGDDIWDNMVTILSSYYPHIWDKMVII